MSRRDLHAELAKRGLLVKGTDPVKALGTMLWRAPDKFIQLEGRGYWNKGQPYPEGGYDPRQPLTGPIGDRQAARELLKSARDAETYPQAVRDDPDFAELLG